MRLAVPALVAIALQAGCLALTMYKPGDPPRDAGAEKVRDAVGAVALKAIASATAGGDGWVPHRCLHGESGDRWHTQFACQKPADAPTQGPVWRFPEAGYVGVLTPVRAAVLAAVVKTGVEVTWASPVEFTGGPEPAARFEVRYLRNDRDVAGEVVGVIHPAGGKADADTRYTDVVVTTREWYTRAVAR
jgi:hypothetical protein